MCKQATQCKNGWSTNLNLVDIFVRLVFFLASCGHTMPFIVHWDFCIIVTVPTTVQHSIASISHTCEPRRCLLTVPRHRRSILGRRAFCRQTHCLELASRPTHRLRLYSVYIPTVTEDILLQLVLACCSALEVLQLCALYTVNNKKRDILFLTITLANLNRFL